MLHSRMSQNETSRIMSQARARSNLIRERYHLAPDGSANSSQRHFPRNSQTNKQTNGISGGGIGGPRERKRRVFHLTSEKCSCRCSFPCLVRPADSHDSWGGSDPTGFRSTHTQKKQKHDRLQLCVRIKDRDWGSSVHFKISEDSRIHAATHVQSIVRAKKRNRHRRVA